MIDVEMGTKCFQYAKINTYKYLLIGSDGNEL